MDWPMTDKEEVKAFSDKVKKNADRDHKKIS